MINWKKCTLEDIACKNYGLVDGPFGSNLPATAYISSGVPVIRGTNLSLGQERFRTSNYVFVSNETAQKLKRSLCKANDIIFTKKGTLGQTGIIPSKQNFELFLLSSNQMKLSVDTDIADPLFVYYYVSAPFSRTKIIQDAMTTGVPKINLTYLKNYQIYLPTIEAQKKIAAILSAYDDLIENNNKRIALLEKAAEEIYREWFVRMRFPDWEKAKFVKGVPEGWEYKSMRELIEFHIGGGWGEDKSSIDFSEGAFVIRGTDLPSINAGEFSREVYRYHKASNFKSRKLKTGDIIFEVAGGSKDQWLGRTAMMTDNILAYFDDRVICASFCKLIRFDKEKISPYFMKYFLALYYSTGLVSTYQVQSTGISNYQFEGFLSGQKVLVPTEDLRNSFDKQVVPLVKQKDILSLVNVKLKETRNLLLTRLISGKLSVEALDIRFPPSMIAQ